MRILKNVLLLGFCLLLVIGVAEEKFKPLPILEAEALMNTGKFTEAKVELDTFVAENETSEWKPLAEFLSLKSDYATKSYETFQSGFAELKVGSPSHSYLPELLVLEGKAYRAEKKTDKALASWREVIANFPDSPQVAEAQEELISELYAQNRFSELFQEVQKVRTSSPTHPALGDFTYLEGDAHLMLHDLGKGKEKLQQVVNKHPKAKSYEKALTLLEVTELLEKVEADPDDVGFSDKLKALIKRRMIISEKDGLSEKIVFDRVYQQGKHWRNQGNVVAAQQAFQMVAEADYLGYLDAQAALDLAQLQGKSQEIEEKTTALQQADVAKALYLDAIAKHKEKNYDEALAIFDQLIQQFPKTDKARDAMLRKGYVLYAAGRKVESLQAFQDALEYNADLPADHPFNLEAKTRVGLLTHAKYYTADDLPHKRPDLYPLLEETTSVYQDLMAALSDGTPEKIHAQMEHAGLLFEKAKNSKGASVSWLDVRNALQAILSEANATRQTKGLVEIMYMETFINTGEYDRAIELCRDYEQKYRDLTREYGTVLCHRAYCYALLKRYDEMRTVYMKILEEIPDDVEWFASLHAKEKAEIWYWYVYTKAGKYYEAEEYLKTVIAKYPNTMQTKRLIEVRERGTCVEKD